MIVDIINQALHSHSFSKALQNEATGFYVQESQSAIRFAVLHRLDHLIEPGELNALINHSAPESFTSNPAFRKNCDLICIHHLSKLAEFKKSEERIFEIEEDPHFYKKYVLYYSDSEIEAIKGLNFNEIEKLISDKEQFDIYKQDPLAPSRYGAAAKLFIKLPFLKFHINKVDLPPLRSQIEEAVAEAELTRTYELLRKHDQTQIDELIMELIGDELEDFKD